MKERFEVEATEGGYRVIDPAGMIVATVQRRHQAFEFVRDWDGRVHLQWARTVIANQTVPCDFSPEHSGFGAGAS
ncbi:hypothetical protein [Mesorhizobium sp. B2-6-2]|uniref:hypothetical protein n=1 Tax=Mesorhizobium sp. B2-6-2 TaxID=2589915 RepID=UPI0011298FB5|nr:hypothetical protein [Mesorhizobium sp. B2-6-2]TPJ82296.1 hypothetical protein FJ419_00465 [Mesorhizobium sp. B2-6-2]